MKKLNSHKGEICRNCKNTLTTAEDYCPKCGQLNDTRRLSIKEYIAESLGNFFSFDSKIISSLVPFLTKPGILSRRYVDGEKVKFVVPFRMYMFFSLIFFLVANAMPERNQLNKFVQQDTPSGLLFSSEGVQKLDSMHVDSFAVDSSLSADSLRDDLDLNAAYQYARQNPDTPAIKALEYIGVKPSGKNIKNYDLSMKIVRMDRSEFLNHVLDRIPLLIFLFMPLLTIILKVFYIRRDFYFSEHLTFLLQTNSMIFLLATLAMVSGKLFSINISLASFIFFTLYFFIAMKNFYKQSWIKTLFKFILLGFCYFLLFPLFTIASIFGMFYIY